MALFKLAPKVQQLNTKGISPRTCISHYIMVLSCKYNISEVDVAVVTYHPQYRLEYGGEYKGSTN
jgi:hypothetical protein